MITTKQRAYLRSLANGIPSILQVGKGGIGEQVIKQADDALEAREIIKGKVLENAPAFAREVAEELAAATNSGRRFGLSKNQAVSEQSFIFIP